MTPSPYPLTDTFGVAKVGDVSGVKLNTPGGPVWTDPWGNAVLPQVNAYGSTHIEIDTKSLPRNVDIQNGFKAVSAGRGSVSTLDFPVIKSRRALLHVTDEDGNAIGKGASVFNTKGGFVTTVVEDGKVFISDVQANEALTISLAEEKSCNVSFTLPDAQDLNVYFETANATCSTS
ncbi:fimbria/pilus outer membrane usher protein [Pseudomonas defluvii]|uniref:fimbria/pilus outer membrane usher protein n=1 Tax=Pseudomonas defluvii TaxID=1876757 RepID=UPI0039062C9B